MPETPPLELSSRYYVVLRDKRGDQAIYPRWRTTSLGPGAAAAVLGADGRPVPESVFHGFPTREEVRAYLVGAQLPEPEWMA